MIHTLNCCITQTSSEPNRSTSSSSSSSAAAGAFAGADELAPPKSLAEAALSPGRVACSASQDLMCSYQRAEWGYSAGEGADFTAVKTPTSACEGSWLRESKESVQGVVDRSIGQNQNKDQRAWILVSSKNERGVLIHCLGNTDQSNTHHVERVYVKWRNREKGKTERKKKKRKKKEKSDSIELDKSREDKHSIHPSM